MRFNLALLIAFICMPSVYAQNHLGVQGGLALSTTTSSKLQGCDFHYDLGGYLGGIYEMDLKNGWKLLPQLNLSYDSTGGNSEQSVYAYYTKFAISVPVELGYSVPVSNHSRVMFSAGPYARFDVFGRDKKNVYHGNEDVSRLTLGWWHASMSDKLDYGLQGGASYVMGKMFLSAKMKYSLKGDSFLNAMGKSLIFTTGIGYYFK